MNVIFFLTLNFLIMNFSVDIANLVITRFPLILKTSDYFLGDFEFSFLARTHYGSHVFIKYHASEVFGVEDCFVVSFFRSPQYASKFVVDAFQHHSTTFLINYTDNHLNELEFLIKSFIM